MCDVLNVLRAGAAGGSVWHSVCWIVVGWWGESYSRSELASLDLAS
jgi:hypothetical protein